MSSCLEEPRQNCASLREDNVSNGMDLLSRPNLNNWKLTALAAAISPQGCCAFCSEPTSVASACIYEELYLAFQIEIYIFKRG